jgi:hypothetical protein
VQRLMWSASRAIVRRKVRTLNVVSAVHGGLVVSSGAAAPDRVLLITLRGDATAARSGPVDYWEAGSWLVRWLVPRLQLTVGRRFLSTSAVVIGTTRARGGPVSCHGTLAARRAPFALLVDHDNWGRIGFSASPSPFATAVSATCPQGVSASTWPLRPAAQRHDLWIFNHPGFDFSLPGFTPLPKGGDSDGWMLAHGVHWLTRLTVTPLHSDRSHHEPSHKPRARSPSLPALRARRRVRARGKGEYARVDPSLGRPYRIRGSAGARRTVAPSALGPYEFARLAHLAWHAGFRRWGRGF